MNTQTYEKWMHPDSVQRIVDGQLSRAELADLIAACQQHPELWKCCAVAFLEEQTLRLELAGLAANWPATADDLPDESNTPGDMLRGAATALPRATPSLERSTGNRRPTEQADLRSATRASWLNHFAFAASVLLAFSIGWQASRRFGNDHSSTLAPEAESDSGYKIVAAANSTSGNNASGTHAPAALPAARGAGPNADTQLAGVVPTGGDAADKAIVGTTPSVAFAADAIDQALRRPEQFVPLDRRIPKPLAELEQRGLVHIESIEGFVPVRLRDGNTAVVPVQQIDLRPVRNAY